MSYLAATSLPIATLSSAILEHVKTHTLYGMRTQEQEIVSALAASALAQRDPTKHTSEHLATLASYAMTHHASFTADVVSIAASVLRQAGPK